MLNLIVKDFKLLFAKNGTRLNRILSYLFLGVVAIAFIALETFLFYTIIRKVSVYDGASDSFFILFLFIICILLTVVSIFTAKKSFFSSSDIAQLATYPISNAKKIFSKLFFLVILMYLLNFVFCFPLFVSYGAIFHKMLIFFYTSLYYPFLILFFELGIAFILVYPFKMLLDFLKKHFLIQLISVIIISFGLAIIYSYVLNLFIDLVSSNQLDKLFTVSNIARIKQIADNLVPINFLIKSIVKYDLGMVFPYIGVSLGIFLIGMALIIYFYSYFDSYSHDEDGKIKEHKYKELSQYMALIKKELILLFRDSNYLFSFTGLLFVEPLLTFLVIKSINTIFTTGNIAYYVAVVPNLIPISDILIMMLFSCIISSGSSNFITSEKKSIRFIKSLPITPLKQLSIKVMIPLSLSILFTFISYLALALTSTLSWLSFGYGLVLTILLIILVNIISLYEELKIKRGKERNYLLSSIYSYLLPFSFFIIGLFMAYNQMNINFIYLVGLALIALFSLPFVIKLKSRINNLFLDLEVIN